MTIDRGDESYNDFFNKHSSAVMHYALRRLDDFESCEDVVVDTFLRGLEKMGRKIAIYEIAKDPEAYARLSSLINRHQ